MKRCPVCDSIEVLKYKVFEEEWEQHEDKGQIEWYWFDVAKKVDEYYKCKECGTKWK